jgi:hypothetical protein
MERFPIIITFGAGLLGWLAGGMIVSDTALAPWLQANLPALDMRIPATSIHLNIVSLVGAIAVVLVGSLLTKGQVKHEI